MFDSKSATAFLLRLNCVQLTKHYSHLLDTPKNQQYSVYSILIIYSQKCIHFKPYLKKKYFSESLEYEVPRQCRHYP